MLSAEPAGRPQVPCVVSLSSGSASGSSERRRLPSRRLEALGVRPREGGAAVVGKKGRDTRARSGVRGGMMGGSKAGAVDASGDAGKDALAVKACQCAAKGQLNDMVTLISRHGKWLLDRPRPSDGQSPLMVAVGCMQEGTAWRLVQLGTNRSTRVAEFAPPKTYAERKEGQGKGRGELRGRGETLRVRRHQGPPRLHHAAGHDLQVLRKPTAQGVYLVLLFSSATEAICSSSCRQNFS